MCGAWITNNIAIFEIQIKDEWENLQRHCKEDDGTDTLSSLTVSNIQYCTPDGKTETSKRC